jgi:hypothetical protein
MKKLATLLTLMAGVGMTFGQAVVHSPGQVNFNNTESAKSGVTGHLITNLVAAAGQIGAGAGLIGTQYVAELYYMDSVTSALTPIVATISQFKPSTTSSPGTWNGASLPYALPAGYGGVDIFDDGSGEAGDGSGIGAGYYPVTLQIRVWDSTGGITSYDNASIRSAGPTFAYTQRALLLATDTQMIKQGPFGITAVPEPSAIALSILGVAGLLLIRRRK